MSDAAVHEVVRRLLDAVEARDIDAVLREVTEDVTWENVPHGPARGRDGLRAMLGPFLAQCERVRWDVVSSARAGDRSFLERVDRFWVRGVEYAIECNGVFRVRDGLVCEVRDYVDVGVWRSRIGDAVTR